MSIRFYCLIGVILTCISIFRYQQLIFSSVYGSEDITFQPPVSVADEPRILSNDMASATPKRIDITCCGIGHRFDTIAAAVRDLNRPIEVNWGPCKDLTNNIFGKIFETNSLFIPYQPSDGDAPFPRMKDLTGIDMASKNLPNEVQEAVVDLLMHNLSDEYMDTVNKFKESVGWDDAPVIGLHIRTGNTQNDTTSNYEKETKQLHRRVGGHLQDSIGLEYALYLYMDHVSALAAEMGISDRHQVLVVTDSNAVLETLGNMTDLPRWFHRPQAYTEVAHPLIFDNLLLNNGGERCQLDWFTEPIIDLHLLASTDAMITSMWSTFYRIAEMAHLKHNRPVCHCSRSRAHPQTCQCVGEEEVLLPEYMF